jgi:hypothetical protein
MGGSSVVESAGELMEASGPVSPGAGRRPLLLGITAREILESGRRAGLSDFQRGLKELP